MEIIKTTVVENIVLDTQKDLSCSVKIVDGVITLFEMKHLHNGVSNVSLLSENQVLSLSIELNKLVAHIKSLNKHEPDINVQTSKDTCYE